MVILEFLRRSLFWTLDFLKGGKIKKHYKDIKFIQESSNLIIVKKRKETLLKNILEHALTTVPFYNREIGGNSLQNFPIINKKLVRENFEQLKSQKFLNNKSNYRVYTSGSTGNPFEIYHDGNKRDRNTADTIYFAEKSGYRLGSRLYYLRLWDKQYKKSNLISWIQNISMHSVDELQEDNIAKLIQKLKNDNSNKNILAYTSALETLCRYLDTLADLPLNIKVDSVIAVAESLNCYVKKSIKKYFGVNVLSRYSNSENGIFAQQSKSGDTSDFEINNSSYYFEILDLEKDIPVQPGVLGRIVVTDLFNFCMPMIRYDTGDVGIMDYVGEDTNRGMVFKIIEGRKMDMFTTTKGEYLSSHIIHKILQYGEIDQFQFIQEKNKEYTIKLKVMKNFDFTKAAKMVKEYQDYFGEGSKVKIEYVDDIPLLPSGKRKLVINNTMNRFEEVLEKA